MEESEKEYYGNEPIYMEKKMKAWQKGYELDTLIGWTNKFEEYNNFCHSPFAKAKKNGMADSLSNNKLFEKDNVAYEMRTAKTTSKVKMFGAGPEIATVLAGEKVITKLSSTFNPVDIETYYESQNEHITNMFILIFIIITYINWIKIR